MNKPVAPIKSDNVTTEDDKGAAVTSKEQQASVFDESVRAVSSDLGYRILGPLCYGYATWLADQARSQGIEHLYFLSRDGWLLKKAFDLLPEESRSGITSHYLYSSRRAVWFASLDESTPEKEYNEILSGASPYLPVGAYFTRIFMDPKEHLDAIREVGFADETSVVDNASDKRKLYKLFSLLRPQIEAQAASERESYLAYLEHSGFFQHKKVGLSDVGWTGSVLKYTRGLAERVDPEVDVHAYFIGVGEMASKKYGFSKGTCLHGYLFDFDDQTHRDILKSFYVIEKFLSPNEPSLIKMSQENGNFKPVHKKGPQEVSPMNFIVQKNALRFIKENAQPNDRPNPVTFVHALEQLLTRPEREVARMLSQYSYSSDFGYEVGAKPIACSRSSTEYLANPIQLLKDYRRARWKAGFVAQQSAAVQLLLRTMRKAKADQAFERAVLWLRSRR